MNWLTLVGSVGIGAIVASLITLGGMFWSKKIDFKRDHYKFLIQKRREAYGFVEEILSAVDDPIHLVRADIGIVTVKKIQVSRKYEEDFVKKLLLRYEEYATKKRWLSAQTQESQEKLFAKLFEIESKLKNSESDIFVLNDHQLESSLAHILIEANERFQYDMLRLYDVSAFFDKKKRPIWPLVRLI